MRIPQNFRRLRAWRTLGAAALLACLAPSTAAAGVVSIILPVRGMTCVLCTRGVEESIKLMDGVGSVAADLTTGTVSVQAAEGKTLNLKDVKDRVARAGFATEGECDLVAAGRFTIGPQGRLTFRITGTPLTYQVLESSRLRRLFREHPGLRGEFRLAFRLHDHPNWKPPAISISSFEVEPVTAPGAAR